MMVCTEKDKVKLPDIHQLALPIVWIKIQPEVVEGADELKSFIERVKAKIA